MNKDIHTLIKEEIKKCMYGDTAEYTVSLMKDDDSVTYHHTYQLHMAIEDALFSIASQTAEMFKGEERKPAFPSGSTIEVPTDRVASVFNGGYNERVDEVNTLADSIINANKK